MKAYALTNTIAATLPEAKAYILLPDCSDVTAEAGLDTLAETLAQEEVNILATN